MEYSLPIFEKILKEAAKANVIAKKTTKAMQWFIDNVNTLKTSFKKSTRNATISKFPMLLGQFYLIQYNPKYAKSLPYYDHYPLILIIDLNSDGFLGLNFHYLPPEIRAKLFQQLLKLETTDWKTKENKLKVTYKLLSAYKKYSAFRPCIKRYLIDHVGSIHVRILSHEWELAMFLPVEKFEKASKEQVWADSKKIIKKYK